MAGLSDEVRAGNNFSNNYFLLSNDIDFQDQSFNAIGCDTNVYFAGNFDGNNNTIGIGNFTNENTTRTYASDPVAQVSYCGLFGYCNGATIRNINLIVNVDFTSSYTSNGLLVGGCTDTEITNINVSMQGHIISAVPTFGTIAGQITSSTVSKCKVEDNITIESPACAGGIVGAMYLSSELSECIINAPVEIFSPQSFGFLAGADYGSSTITNNLVMDTATIQAPSRFFGFIVSSGDGLYQNNIFNFSQGYSETNCSHSNGLLGSTSASCINNAVSVDNLDGTPEEYLTESYMYTNAQLKLRSTYNDWTDFDEYWVINSSINSGYPMLRANYDIDKKGIFAGRGTQNNPYLLKTRKDMDNMSTFYNNGGASDNIVRYWQLANDIDMNGDTDLFTPIGSSSSKKFQGFFDGKSYNLTNLQIAIDVEGGLFGYVNSSTISNLNMEIIFTQDRTANFGGLAGYVNSSSISNINVAYTGACTGNIHDSGSLTALAGLIMDASHNSTIENCVVQGFIVDVDLTLQYSSINYGGLVASVGYTTITGCMAESYATVDIVRSDSGAFTSRIGGLIGIDIGTNRIYNNNLSCGKLMVTDSTNSHSTFIGGMIGFSGYKDDGDELKMQNNLSLCDVEVVSSNKEMVIAGLGTEINSGTYSKYNISNGIINARSIFYLAGGVDTSATSTAKVVYNKDRYSVTGATTNNTVGATSDANMKLRSTYANWEDFDTYWVIDAKYNSGYPMLKTFKDMFLSPLFEGKGTETEPYLISTQQELLNINDYYADTDNAKADVYFKLMNDIDISRDANNMLIHFTPICYNREFDGYFDGNGKTISGLLIDNQYEYTGLFGTIGANHWVKNLTVKGDIYWDQAYAVGGVAGRVLAGGYLQNCSFNGNIIGILNTKSSTETSGVVGKYEINGAIDCTATYTDLKYAKIGGTTDAPTYTYYLYDWAQITTTLYNKKVG